MVQSFFIHKMWGKFFIESISSRVTWFTLNTAIDVNTENLFKVSVLLNFSLFSHAKLITIYKKNKINGSEGFSKVLLVYFSHPSIIDNSPFWYVACIKFFWEEKITQE